MRSFFGSNDEAIIRAKNEQIHALTEALELEEYQNNLRITELSESNKSKEAEISDLKRTIEQLQHDYDQNTKNYQVEFERNQTMVAENNELKAEIERMKQSMSSSIYFCKNAAKNLFQNLNFNLYAQKTKEPNKATK